MIDVNKGSVSGSVSSPKTVVGSVSVGRAVSSNMVIDDHTLKINDKGVLSVNTANEVEKDNTLPVTSAAVHTQIGNIDILLQTI